MKPPKVLSCAQIKKWNIRVAVTVAALTAITIAYVIVNTRGFESLVLGIAVALLAPFVFLAFSRESGLAWYELKDAVLSSTDPRVREWLDCNNLVGCEISVQTALNALTWMNRLGIGYEQPCGVIGLRIRSSN